MMHDLITVLIIAALIAGAVGTFAGCLVAALSISDFYSRKGRRGGVVVYAVTAAFLLVVTFGTEIVILNRVFA